MLYVVAYDIVDDSRRRRVLEALKDFGRRVQYSVFECALEPEDLNRLLDRLRLEIEAAEDSVRVYRLCAACENEVLILGQGDRYSEPGYVIV